MAVTARELIFKIVGDNEKFNKAIEDSTKRLEDFKNKTKDANELFGKVAKMSALATTAIAGVGIAAAKLAKDFNEGFGAVQTLIPGATERIKELQQNVLDLSPLVGKSTQDLTSGLYEVVSAFGDSADSAKNLELAAKGAMAGGASTKDAIALLSAVTKAYGDTTNAAQKKVSDLAFTTVKLGQTNFPELAASIQRVTSQSKTLKISQEELFTIFSSGTGVIGGAAEVSTKYSALLTEMQKPGDRLAKTFQNLGAASGEDLIAKFGGLQGALQALKNEAEKTGEPISNLFGSAEAGKLALYAAGEGAAKFKSDLEAMHGAIGATDQAFNDATISGPNAFGFQLQQAGLNAKAFAIKVGQDLIPSIQSLLSPVFKLAEGLKKLNEDQIHLITSIGKVLLAVTGITAGLFTLGKSVLAVKKAIIVLDGAFKAIGLTNPFALAIAGAAAAVVAIKELCSWIDRAKEKQKEVERQNLKTALSFPKEAENAIALSKAYIELSEKEKLSAEEKLKLQKQTQSLIALVPSLAGKLSLEENGYKNNLKVLKEFNEAKIKEIELNIQNAKTAHGNISKIIADNEAHIEVLKETNKLTTKGRGENLVGINDDQIKKEKDALKDLIEKEKIYAQEIEKNELLLAQLKDSKTSLEDASNANKKSEDDREDKNKAKTKTQSERLKELDSLYDLELQLLEKQNLSESEKLKEKERIEKEHYEKRLDLLKTFHKENVTQKLEENNNQNITLEKSLAKEVGEAYESIEEVIKETNDKLEQLGKEKNARELEELKSQTDRIKEEIEKRVKIKKDAKLYEGENEKEINKNAANDKDEMLQEKINELMEQYIRLSSSANDEDKKKANIILENIKELEEFKNAAKNASESAGDAFAKMANKVADKIKEVGGKITEMFSQIADTAKLALDNREEKRNQEKNKRLAEIDRERNEELLKIDNELSEHREQKQIEDAEREEQRRQVEYDKKLGEYNRSIEELKGQMETETNLEALKHQEKQLEENQRKKAEEVKRKKEEDEKRKRDKESRMQEVALLNARASADHEFAVARIQTENQAGVAAAQAAQQAAKWQKAQSILNLSLKAAEETVRAAEDFAQLNFIGGAMHTGAAAVAGVQIGLISAQPLPPDYIVQPIPSPPRPIKFAQGGIVMPTKGGTHFNLPSGHPAIAGEAGSAELILPINMPNLQNMFKAAGYNNTDNSKSLSYNPSYHFEISQNQEQDLTETIMKVLKDRDRDVYNLMNVAEINYKV